MAWCCHDSYAPRPAVHHFGQAVKLATQAEDNVAASYALRHAAMIFLDRREPNDELKLVQLAQVHLNDAPGQDPRAAPLRAWLSAENALALAEMSGSDSTAKRARSQLDCAWDGYDPPGSHARADMDLLAAQVHLRVELAHIDEVTTNRGCHITVHEVQRLTQPRRATALEQMAHDPLLGNDGIEYLTGPERVFLTLAMGQRGRQVIHDTHVNSTRIRQGLRYPGALVSVQIRQTHGGQRPTGQPHRLPTPHRPRQYRHHLPHELLSQRTVHTPIVPTHAASDDAGEALRTSTSACAAACRA